MPSSSLAGSSRIPRFTTLMSPGLTERAAIEFDHDATGVPRVHHQPGSSGTFEGSPWRRTRCNSTASAASRISTQLSRSARTTTPGGG